MAVSTRVLSAGIRAMLVLCTCFMLSVSALAGTYWVSPTGTAAWASCVGSTPLSGTAACSLPTANSKAAAGDVVYLRGGTYDMGGGFSVAFSPSHIGSAGPPIAMITFVAYTKETPTITNAYAGLDLQGSYVSIKGITFSNIGNFYIEKGANHNEVANNTFQDTQGGMSFWVKANGGGFVTHNWIHDNHFDLSGQANGNGGLGCTDGGGDIMNIGGAGTSSQDNHNTVENNFFEHNPHAAIDQFGMYNVFRNNIFHNEPWSTASAACLSSGTFSPSYSSSNPNYSAYNGKYAHRDWQVSDDQNRTANYLLIEGNRSGYAGVNQANDGADDLSLAAPGNIVRYNFFYASMSQGLMFKYGWAYGNGTNGGTYNRVYNNTFYNNGLGYPFGYSQTTCTQSVSTECPFVGGNITLYDSGSSGIGNVLKNNLMYQSNSYTMYTVDVTNKNPGNGWARLTGGGAINNWCTAAQTSSNPLGTGCSAFGDPKFTNPDLSNPASTTLPDLSLQSGSGAIDKGTYLTTATNSGSNSTSLTVADALYFQDGTWGSDLAKASAGLCGSMQADWIAIGTVANVVQISSVTYGTYKNPTGSITLATPMTWSNGASIWLYRKSDGTVVLNGAAPDYGASEYGVVAQPQCVQAAAH